VTFKKFETRWWKHFLFFQREKHFSPPEHRRRFLQSAKSHWKKTQEFADAKPNKRNPIAGQSGLYWQTPGERLAGDVWVPACFICSRLDVHDIAGRSHSCGSTRHNTTTAAKAESPWLKRSVLGCPANARSSSRAFFFSSTANRAFFSFCS